MSGNGLTPREQVLELLAAYCLAIDDRRLDELWPLFADDCELVLRDGVSANGRDEIRQLLGSLARNAIRHRHIVTNTSVTIDGDVARARSDWYLMKPDGHESWLVEGAGSYDDEMRHDGGRWLFTRRVIATAPR